MLKLSIKAPSHPKQDTKHCKSITYNEAYKNVLVLNFLFNFEIIYNRKFT